MPDVQNTWPAQNPVTVRASAALPASGAYDASPTEFATAGIEHITFYVTYTRGGAGGDVRMRLETSPYSANAAGVESWFRMSCAACGTIASGADTIGNVQREDIEYGSTGAATEMFVYGPVELDKTVERMRVPCAETGAVGTPGTVHIVAMMV